MTFKIIGILLFFPFLTSVEANSPVSGFARERLTYSAAALNPTCRQFTSNTELNIQFQEKEETYQTYLDASFFVEDLKVRANELYASKQIGDDGLSIVLGKKRVVWGSGLSSNPTDLLNPAKDLTEPLNQREGAWITEIEQSFATQAISLVVSPGVEQNLGGGHYLIGSRYYSLLAGADLNLMAYYSDIFTKHFAKKWIFAASGSRFFGSIGLNTEILLSEKPRLLMGIRYHFQNDAEMIFEFLHQPDGLSDLPIYNYFALHYGDYNLRNYLSLAGDGFISVDQKAGYIGPSLQWADSDIFKMTLRYLEPIAFSKNNSISEQERSLCNQASIARSLMLEIKAFY